MFDVFRLRDTLLNIEWLYVTIDPFSVGKHGNTFFVGSRTIPLAASLTLVSKYC